MVARHGGRCDGGTADLQPQRAVLGCVMLDEPTDHEELIVRRLHLAHRFDNRVVEPTVAPLEQHTAHRGADRLGNVPSWAQEILRHSINAIGWPVYLGTFEALQRLAHQDRAHINVIPYSPTRTRMDMFFDNGVIMDENAYNNITPGAATTYWTDFETAFDTMTSNRSSSCRQNAGSLRKIKVLRAPKLDGIFFYSRA